MAMMPTPTSALTAASSGVFEPPPTTDIFYGSVDGSLYYGGASHSGASTSFGGAGAAAFPAGDGVLGPGAPHGA